jgi:phosphatidylserine/phosphatidylglycerophosphate/cardiolipin synthase-like enzyme
VVSDYRSNSDKYSAAQFLADQGVAVRLNSKYQIHHHKFFVIDNVGVETGRFNFYNSAVANNAENIIILRGVPEIAAEYVKQWQELWDEGEDMKAAY